MDNRVPLELPVALSACETALGASYFTEVLAGDDFVGLTRALLFAGSHSVLASLWKVDDRSTLELMEAFYRHRERAESAVALAEAQRLMRQGRGRYRHPYFWAASVLVGKMQDPSDFVRKIAREVRVKEKNLGA